MAGKNIIKSTEDKSAYCKIAIGIGNRTAIIEPTTGINRVRSSLTDQPEPRDAVKSLSYWNSYQYFNIWTVKRFAPQPDGNTLLGYAQFPNVGSMSTDGIVILYGEMADPQSTTLTHEVGHVIYRMDPLFRDVKETLFHESLAWYLGYHFMAEHGYIIDMEEYKKEMGHALKLYRWSENARDAE